jgi:hypothetical protein
VLSCDRRHEDSGDVATRHAPDAGQRVAALLLRLLYLRDRRGPAVGGYTEAALLPQGPAQRQVSRVSQGEPSPHCSSPSIITAPLCALHSALSISSFVS